MKKFVMIALVCILAMAFTVSTVSAAPPESGGYWYTVQKGDTLSSIAYSHGTKVSYLIHANQISNPDFIYYGQRLWIPDNYGQNPPHSGKRYHTIRYGDTLYSIGRHYGVSPWAIANANGIYNVNRIYAGQVLHIPL